MDDLNEINNNWNGMSGEAAVVVAARGGQVGVLCQLLNATPLSAATLSPALHAAASAGQVEAVKALIEFGANVDAGSPDPPLIAALATGHVEVSMLLIQHGADTDIKDSRGNSCLHLACASGLYNVVRSLCALGSVQGPNFRGQYPLHIAARNGHLQIVRLLCFYGCKLDQRNGDGIKADITALKYGHNHIADLLDKLRACGYSCGALRSQLLWSGRAVSRVQLRLVGHSGAGKSALAASLNAGLLHALFRRSSSLNNRSRPSSPCQSSHIEMDVTHRHSSLSFDSCSTADYAPTKGVEVHQMDISGVGDVTVWDFSGQECYFQIYHHFLSDASIPPPSPTFSQAMARRSLTKCMSSDIAKYTAANDNVITSIGCAPSEHTTKPHVFDRSKYALLNVYVVMFNLEKPYSVQLQQCMFWLNFILSKLSPCTAPGGLGRVVLVGSHADLRAHRTPQGEYVYPAGDTLMQQLSQHFKPYFKILPQVLALDCNASTSAGIRTLKTFLSFVKQSISQASLGQWSGFLESTLAWIVGVRKSMETFPVMELQVFIERVRSRVNLLASEEHIMDVIHHLHIMGEVLYVGGMVVLCCSWMSSVLGALMGRSGLSSARALGVYTAHDFQAHFGYCDASQLLKLLQEMRLCTMCEVDDEEEYEFPCFNLVETLEGLWDPDDPRYQPADACYGGLVLQQPSHISHLVASLFPHIQVELRDYVERLHASEELEAECDLYQWWHGSKLCWGQVECLLTLEGGGGREQLHLKVRGPPASAHTCSQHSHTLQHQIQQAVGRVCAGLVLECHTLSAQQLRTHCAEPHSWSNRHVITQLYQHRITHREACSYTQVCLWNPNTNKPETLQALLFYDDPSVSEAVQWCMEMSVSDLPVAVLTRLSALLDPPHPLGADWCMLAVSLGLSQDCIAAFDSDISMWHTTKLLKSVKCTVGTLLDKLKGLCRPDAEEVILRFTPPYTLHQPWRRDHGKVDEEKIKPGSELQEVTRSDPPIQCGGSKIHTDV